MPFFGKNRTSWYLLSHYIWFTWCICWLGPTVSSGPCPLVRIEPPGICCRTISGLLGVFAVSPVCCPNVRACCRRHPPEVPHSADGHRAGYQVGRWGEGRGGEGSERRWWGGGGWGENYGYRCEMWLLTTSKDDVALLRDYFVVWNGCVHKEKQRSSGRKHLSPLLPLVSFGLAPVPCARCCSNQAESLWAG